MDQPKNEHLVKDNGIPEYYPNHEQRTESKTFRETKTHWHKMGAVCWICKTKDKIEIHHRFVEWAMAHAIDKQKLMEAHPDFEHYDDPNWLELFIDSIYNTVPLCELHHRHPWYGVHHNPNPTWEIQRYTLENFVLFPEYVKK